MLMLSVLGMFSGEVKAPEGHDGHREAVLEVTRNMALGLEIAEGVAIGVEVTKVQATILQRWDWYRAKPGAAMTGVHQPRHRRAA